LARNREELKGTAVHASLSLAAIFAAALAAVPALGALPPQYQRLAELRAVLEHPGVAAAFSVMEPIDRIEYAGPDLYRVTAGRCRLDVRIADLPIPRGMVGARHFEARPGRRVCSR
jgi:hypothetical protein